MSINENLLNWMLDIGDPSLRLRVLVELLGRGADDPEVLQAQQAIPGSPAVRGLLESMHPEGYWTQKHVQTGVVSGAGVEYGSFATTHFCLAYLAELGLDRSQPQVALAAERYLGLQQPDGDWWQHLSCLQGYNLRTFIRLGYRRDPRLQRTVDLLLNTRRRDGGCLCDLHELKRPRSKSCVRGSAKVLLALAELPETWDHPRCRELVDYFLRRGGVFRSKYPSEVVNDDMGRLSFPLTWRTNAWEIVLGLSRMGCGEDERLKAAWELVEGQADPDGRYRLDWTPAQCPWKVGRRGEPNPWVTFYVLLAEKWRRSSSPAV
jgi:hypothetical protein